MGWQQTTDRVKATDGSVDIILPVDTITIEPVVYLPEEGTVRELYDHRKKYQNPSYGYHLTLEYAYERTDYRSDQFHTLKDLIAEYDSGKVLDFFVKHDGGGNYDSNYKCPQMIPDITQDVANIMFEQRSRKKSRSLELFSTNNDKTFSQINWIFD